ncbi:hypothetical protein VTJ49DRAFT_6273 [Mycothermus thermophilus]|uniref:Major facilitator superfamily transporter n=1 Tax=Humicola insolens TaxID=85995 RepID=A0ABR3VJ84_HUMIN
MGLTAWNPFRARKARGPRLPLYRGVPSSRRRTRRPPGSPTKERYSDSDYSSEDSDDDDTTDMSDSEGSRRTSSSASSAAALIHPPRRPAAPPARRRLPVRPYGYRLPHKIMRCLCFGMISTLIIFILVLIRASHLENKRLAEGKVPMDKKPVVPPPWEQFEFLTRYYGGVKSVVPLAQNGPQYPRLEDIDGPYNGTQVDIEKKTAPPSKAFAEYPGAGLPRSAEDDGIHECFLDAQNTVRVPSIRYLEGRPDGFPDNVLGSYELLSLPEDICFDRFGRYGPYGYGYSVRAGGLGLGNHGDKAGAEAVWETTKQVDWRTVDWADAQRRCYQTNAGRYKPLEVREPSPRGFYIGDGLETSKLATRSASPEQTAQEPASDTPQGAMPRTAVVLRCWDEFPWNEEDILNLRALISELSLASGGRYDVHLLVQVRNDGRNPIWADDDEYRRRINDTVPREFQGIATLWSETQMLAVYQGVRDLWTSGPDLPVHGSYRGLQMAMQLFASQHPEYEYFWQWEMDIRYTGHYHDLLSKLENWAREQPRKGLWERNARFYMPHVHGSWEDFKQMVRVQTEQGAVTADNIWEKVPDKAAAAAKLRRPGPGSGSTTANNNIEKPIWGPERPQNETDWFEHTSDPTPPTTYDRDRYTWGVGEEADLVTLSPIFDPEGTTWKLADDITGYYDDAKPPRRAHIITASRLSRRLLVAMHRETAFKKHHAFSEMWPATVALHHGYKAVFAPHPVFVDRAWPVDYMARVLNAGRNGASGGARSSVYGDREHNMRGLTWFYNAGFSGNLYRRWMGLRVNNDGGEEFETVVDPAGDGRTVGTMKGGEGRMCLPPMLLHPIKEVKLPVEREEGRPPVVVESDPAA